MDSNNTNLSPHTGQVIYWLNHVSSHVKYFLLLKILWDSYTLLYLYILSFIFPPQIFPDPPLFLKFMTLVIKQLCNDKETFDHKLLFCKIIRSRINVEYLFWFNLKYLC